MTSDLDIWRSANLLVKEHREDTLIQAAMRADMMLAKGDLDRYVVRWRIIRAVEELRATASSPGAKVH